MDRWSFSDNKMFYAMFDWCSSKVRCRDVWKYGEQHVILVGRACNGAEIRCLGLGCAQWDGKESHCIHKTITFEVKEESLSRENLLPTEGEF